LLGSGSKRNPQYVTSLFGDGGLQVQAILAMIYVQAALDLEAKHALPPSLDLSLPADFPEAWLQSSSSSSSLSSSLLSSLSSLFSSLLSSSSSSSPLTNPIPSITTSTTFEMNLTTSKMQRDVSRAFTRIGFTHAEEHVITMEQLAREYGIRVPDKPIGVFAIDIVHVDDKIAVEVDGPYHFISVIDTGLDNTSNAYVKLMQGKQAYQLDWNGDSNGNGTLQRVNGSTVLKDRLLQGLGWRVLHVPYWE
jgi:very-short-patch-repair endonuclease